jgi:hypothetical protein
MQKFENNMSVKNKPTISKGKGKDFTQVKFVPDLKRYFFSLSVFPPSKGTRM